MFVLQEFYIKQEIYYTSHKKIPREGQFLKKNETILNFSNLNPTNHPWEDYRYSLKRAVPEIIQTPPK